MRQPRWIPPMLATLTDERFSDAGWIFEKKLDGVRCLAIKRKGHVTLFSRNHKVMNSSYPELVEALEKQKEDGFIIDGEIVAVGKKPTFSALQKRMHVKSFDKTLMKTIPVALYVFDVLYAKNTLWTKHTLLKRKKILKELFAYRGKLRYLSHVLRQGEKYFRRAVALKWEGIIAKNKDAPYRSSRSRDWQKWKCTNNQEMVICGFTKPQGSRKGFGALLIAYYVQGRLHYGGKVGTGYDTELLVTLSKKLQTLIRKTSPLYDKGIQEKNVTWVEPKLVAQVGFTEWTKEGKLRHPTFLGLRQDKKARDVIKE